VFQFGRFTSATGQRWKYRIWLVATLAALIISGAFFSLWNGNPAGLPEGLTTGLYFLVCIFWFVWWAAAIRCPFVRYSHQLVPDEPWFGRTCGGANRYDRRMSGLRV
jgi:hypothetical protein